MTCSTDVPDPTVVSSPRGELVLRLHFEAEHSNVLIVSAELLNGCLAHTEVQTMSLELLPDQHTLIVSVLPCNCAHVTSLLPTAFTEH